MGDEYLDKLAADKDFGGVPAPALAPRTLLYHFEYRRDGEICLFMRSGLHISFTFRETLFFAQVSKLALVWDSNIRQPVLENAAKKLTGKDKDAGLALSKQVRSQSSTRLHLRGSFMRKGMFHYVTLHFREFSVLMDRLRRHGKIIVKK